MSEYARVYLLDNPYFLDRAFEYFIPSELRGRIQEGDFVTVPFGNSNRKKLGLVSELCEKEIPAFDDFRIAIQHLAIFILKMQNIAKSMHKKELPRFFAVNRGNPNVFQKIKFRF